MQMRSLRFSVIIIYFICVFAHPAYAVDGNRFLKCLRNRMATFFGKGSPLSEKSTGTLSDKPETVVRLSEPSQRPGYTANGTQIELPSEITTSVAKDGKTQPTVLTEASTEARTEAKTETGMKVITRPPSRPLPPGTLADGTVLSPNTRILMSNLGKPDNARTLGSGSFGDAYFFEFRGQRPDKSVAYIPAVLKTSKHGDGVKIYSFGAPRSYIEAEGAAFQVLQKGKRGEFVLGATNEGNVVRAYAVGKDYLVLEYVDGIPMDQWLTRSEPRSRMQGKEAVDTLKILRGIANGMKTIHEAGIVHRDIKPGNIMIETGTHRPVIIDLGLSVDAKEIYQQGQGENPLGGTRNFMPPEVKKRFKVAQDTLGSAPMEKELLSGRHVDVYSLGVAFLNTISKVSVEKINDFIEYRPYKFAPKADVMKQRQSIVQSKVAMILKDNPNVPNPLAELVTEMVHPDFARRPNIRTIIERLDQIAAELQRSPNQSREFINRLLQSDD